MKAEWIKTNNYYNREIVKCDVWSKQISKLRTIYLQDSKESSFQFTFSCGASSDFSFTGCFYLTNIDTIEKAKDYLNKFAPLWFSDNFKGIKELKDTIVVKYMGEGV